MRKLGIIIVLFLTSMLSSCYYLYKHDKKSEKSLDQAKLVLKPQTDSKIAVQNEKNPIPFYLSEDFWKSVTPQKLKKQLKNIKDVNELRPDNKKSMLHLLVQYGLYPKMVQMLISAGVDYNLKDKVKNHRGEIDNRNALIYAISRDDKAYEFTLPLLKHIDKDASLNNDNVTPLIIATYWRKPKIVKTLLEMGADPNLPEKKFQSLPIITAVVFNRFNNDTYVDPNTIQLLLDHNADITAKDKDGKKAFDYMKGNPEFRKTELFKKLSQQFSQQIINK